jgi:hypothetical protein
MHIPTVYENKGFPDRHTYLVSLAGEYGVPLRTVKYYDSILDDNEDFDALITILEELSNAN